MVNFEAKMSYAIKLMRMHIVCDFSKSRALFVFCFESHEQFFSYLATVTITGYGAA
jgi:hypothetical protein